MRLSELVSSLGLSIYPIIGLIGFGLAFLIIMVRAALRTRTEMLANATIPLEDGTIAPSPSNRTGVTTADSNGSDA